MTFRYALSISINFGPGGYLAPSWGQGAHLRDPWVDVAVISDTQILGPSQPALTCSLRGMLSLELEVTGPDRNLHSGSYGGAIHNPIQALNEILCQLHDSDGLVSTAT